MEEERVEKGLEEQLKQALASEEPEEEQPVQAAGEEVSLEEPQGTEAADTIPEEPEGTEAADTIPVEPEGEKPPEAAPEEGKPEASEPPRRPEKPRKKKKKKKGKIIALVLVLLILAAAAVYVGFSYQYKDKFFKGTTINGMDCSGLTVAQVEEELKRQTEDYTLTVQFRDGQTESIDGSEIGYTYASDGSVQAVKDSQIPLLWITSLFQTGHNQAAADAVFDREKLEEALLALPEMQEEQMTAPSNAYVAWQDSGFSIVPETEGSQLDTQKVLEAAAQAVENAETELDVESLGAYAEPSVRQDDETLRKQQEELTTLVSASITYTLPSGETQKLDGSTLKDWLTQDADGNYVKDENVWNQHIQEYVAALADSVDTLGKDRQFQTTNRGVITRNSNLYGWKIDQEEEIAQLTQELADSAVTTREPIYSSREVSAENNGIGYTYVEMDLSQQHLWVYENGELWGETDIVSGTMTEARHTPECISTIYYKEKDRQLRGPQNPDGSYRWDTHVDYWMPFQDSGMIGMHDAWWQSSFGGTNYLYGGSQGCINLPPEFAARLYEWITTEVPVICYYSEPYTLHE